MCSPRLHLDARSLHIAKLKHKYAVALAECEIVAPHPPPRLCVLCIICLTIKYPAQTESAVIVSRVRIGLYQDLRVSSFDVKDTMLRLQRLPVLCAHAHSMQAMTASASGRFSSSARHTYETVCVISHRHCSSPKTGIDWREPTAASPASVSPAPRQPWRAVQISGRGASSATSAATSVVATRSAAVEAPPRRRGFWLAPDLVDCLRRFNGLRTAVLQDFTDVQTQLHLGANKVDFWQQRVATRPDALE